jgi:hypothetical protein
VVSTSVDELIGFIIQICDIIFRWQTIGQSGKVVGLNRKEFGQLMQEYWRWRKNCELKKRNKLLFFIV